MHILILEDEPPAVKHLQQLIRSSQLVEATDQLTTHESVAKAIPFLRMQPRIDLIFSDIQLADGLSFDIFDQVEITTPVIFTTAYDQYVLDAFRLNSVDYLLKPIERGALHRSLEKYHRHWQQPAFPKELLSQIKQRLGHSYKERFLVRFGQQLGYIKRSDVAYFFAEDGLVFAQLRTNKRHHIDYSIDQLEELLPPTEFFRISRKAMIHLESIRRIQSYFSGRLLLELQPVPEFKVTVSRDRVADFKLWLDR